MSLSLLLAFALAALQQPVPGGVEQAEATGLLNFSYVWPEAAERDPALLALLRTRMEAARERALADARQTQREARANGYELRPYYFTQSWRLTGDSGGLLSLTAVVETFANGGPPEGDVETLLWDSAERRAVPIAELVGPMLPGLEQRYCASLDEVRTDIRGEPGRRDPATRCPPLAEQQMAIEDINGNGRFDRLAVFVPPYGAGPNDEDPYTAEVDLEAADLAHIPGRYRAAFQPVNDRPPPLPNE